MNKKEFEEKFTVEYSAHYKEHKRKYIITSTLSDELWQWKEKEIKDARIDENERLIKIIKERGTWSQTSMGFTINDFECRIKELGEEND